MFLENVDPLVIAIVAGMFGGFTHVIYLYLTKNDEWMEIIESGNQQNIINNTFYYVFLGTIASILTWGFSSILNNNIGTLVTGILAGYAGALVINQYVQIRHGQKNTVTLSQHVATENDELKIALEKANDLFISSKDNKTNDKYR